jgi:hypothetical protein
MTVVLKIINDQDGYGKGRFCEGNVGGAGQSGQ